MKNSSKPAYAQSTHREEPVSGTMGLTKREHFAGLAMQGMLSNSCKDYDISDLCVEAIEHADSLLRNLAR